jgi:hypothetical protein
MKWNSVPEGVYCKVVSGPGEIAFEIVDRATNRPVVGVKLSREAAEDLVKDLQLALARSTRYEGGGAAKGRKDAAKAKALTRSRSGRVVLFPFKRA